jgi:hypothetical protein
MDTVQYHNRTPLSEEILSRAAMEELLPDYALHQLDAEQQVLFERSLPLYPDLQADIDDLRAAFDSENMQEFRRTYAANAASALRNLSFHVQERLEHEQRRRRKRWLVWNRYALPALAVSAVLTVIMVSSFPDNLATVFYSVRSTVPEASQQEIYLHSAWSEPPLLRSDEALLLQEEDSPNGLTVLESDVSFNNNLAANAFSQEVELRESLLAARLLTKETLAELAVMSFMTSPFNDRFAGESALLQALDEGDLDDADLATLLAES